MSAASPSPDAAREPVWGSAASVRAEMALAAPQGGGPRANQRRGVHQTLDGFLKNWNGVAPVPRPRPPDRAPGPASERVP